MTPDSNPTGDRGSAATSTDDSGSGAAAPRTADDALSGLPGAVHRTTAVPRRVCVIGAGYVGLTAAACLATLGLTVRCVETDPRRVEQLRQGVTPTFEPGLDDLVTTGMAEGRLSFFRSIRPALAGAEVVLLCVGTPPQPTGEPDLGYLAIAARQVAATADRDLVVVVKSTVPPGSCEALELLCAEEARPGVTVKVASSPEFLRESRAVADFMHPDRVVVGTEDDAVADLVGSLYPDGTLVVRCDRRGAELVKYAANTFLALKISFANEVAGLCDVLGTDADTVLAGVGLDQRIGTAFFRPGPGYGGSCLSKDVAGFQAEGTALGAATWLADAADRVNERARQSVVTKLRNVLGDLRGAQVAVLGLAFKDGTDDTRDSPGLDVVAQLVAEGASVRAHDPLAPPTEGGAVRVDEICTAIRGADAVVITIRAEEYRCADPAVWARWMRGCVVVDAAGACDLAAYAAAGLLVYGVGRGVPVDFAPVIWSPLRWAHSGRSTASA